MKKKYFGTDGIRGRVGDSFISPDFILKLGYSFGNILQKKISKNHRATVLIGKDTRISGYMLEGALQAGLTASGVKVLLTGPLPTAGVSYLTKALRLDAGIMISASHNPYYDNGIKFFNEDGLKFNDNMELLIEKELEKTIFKVDSDHLGKARRIDGAVDRYIEFCKSTFPNNINLRGLKIVVDTANGAAHKAAKNVFHELGSSVIVIGCSPNGFNINEKAGVMNLDNIKKQVLASKADYGIALDGDGDRLILLDNKGNIYNGDHLTYVIAKAKKKQSNFKGGVVGTLMTNMAMEIALNKINIPFKRSLVGDRYVLEELYKNNWILGGEPSGHILCLDKHNAGDGIISALQVLSSLNILQQNLKQAIDWTPLPQVVINVKINKNKNWKTLSKKSLDFVESELSKNNQGRVVVRQSGTESLVRVMVESKNKELSYKYANQIACSINNN